MTIVDIDRQYLAQQFIDWCAEIGLSPEEFESAIAFEQDKEHKTQT